MRVASSPRTGGDEMIARRRTARTWTAAMVLLAGTAWAEFGDPLDGLTAAQRERFAAGRDAFEEVEGVADGLGPVFNADSCAACHNVGATGGGSERMETRFGRTVSRAFDPMTSRGGSLIQAE